MKKPNLTKGEWEIKEDKYGPYIGTQYDSICTVDTHNHDAKAISAVPEMIDVLMEILEEGSFYNSAIELDFNADGEIIEHKIRKALKKAGCTEDEILNND